MSLELQKEDKLKMEKVGISTDTENPRGGSFILVEDEVVESNVNIEGVEMYPINKALEKYDWLQQYFWKLVDPNKDEFTKVTYEQKIPQGYFIRVGKGIKAKLPLQSCFYIKGIRDEQIVHNIIIAEEDSELHILNGCAAANYSNKGKHIGITEIFVKKNAFLSYTMVHDWAPTVDVRPRSAISVEEGGKFISNYITMNEVHSLHTAPTVFLNGKNSNAKLSSIIFAPEKSNLFVGGKIVLNAPGAQGHIISRVVTNGGQVTAPAELQAESDGVSGFMECSGIILKDNGRIYSQPSLNSSKNDVELSHEASIGKIGQEEISYLMSRGISEDDARSLIVHGFLDIKIKGLPKFLQEAIDLVIEQSLKGM